MPKEYVLNKFRNTMHKMNDDRVVENNPMYPTFDTFSQMKHFLLGRVQGEIKLTQNRLNDLEEEFLDVMSTEEKDIDVFTREGK